MEDPVFNWRFVLYRLYDIHRCLLYVGRTNDIRGRFYQHSQTQPWWPEVVDASIEFLPNADALVAAERIAIYTENPRYNMVRTAPRLQSLVAKCPTKLEREHAFTSVEEAIDNLLRVHGRSVSAIEVLAATDPVRAFQLSNELAERAQKLTTAVAGLRASAALRIQESEDLSFKELAIRLGVSTTRAYQLVKVGAVYRDAEHLGDPAGEVG